MIEEEESHKETSLFVGKRGGRMNRRIQRFLCGILILGMIVATIPLKQTHKVSAAEKFKIHFIDVGCADGALLQYGEGKNAKYAMIDAGASTYNETKSKKYQKKSAPAYEYLKKMGVKHLEFVVLTHPHQDHIGGMIKILKDQTITIDTIYGNSLNFKYVKSDDDKTKQSAETAKWTKFDSKAYRQLKQEIEKRNKKKDEALHVSYKIPKAGSTIRLGQAKVTFYGPLGNDYHYGKLVDLNTRQINKYSIVTRIVYGNNSFLMTGDAQKETVEKMIKKGYNLKAQVLKEPHHGYQDLTEKEKLKKKPTSNHKLLIDHTKANITVISNGYQNTGNVPTDLVRKDLSGKDVYETADKGTIIITSDGSYLSVKTEKGGQKPSIAGKIVSSKKQISMPLLQSIDIKSNMKTKLSPVYVGAKNQKNVYTNKEATIKISGNAKSFIKMNEIEYKYVKNGKNSSKVPYKKGKSITIKNGNCGKIYIKYQTTFGAREVKLPRITVDTKAPTKTKLVKKRSRYHVKVSFYADYGISGKQKTQYKIVPKGKNEKKYKWKNASKIMYNSKKNKKSRLYVRFIDKSGNSTIKKMNL